MVPIPFGMSGAPSTLPRSSVIGDTNTDNDDYYNDTDSEEQRSVDYHLLSSDSATVPLLHQQLLPAQQLAVPLAALSLQQPAVPLSASAAPQLPSAQQLAVPLPVSAAPQLLSAHPLAVPPAAPLLPQQLPQPYAA
eukprot:1752752-Amphidinium_carterae.1